MTKIKFTQGQLNALPILIGYESQRRRLENTLFKISQGNTSSIWRTTRSSYVDNYGRFTDDASSVFYLRNYDPRVMEIELGCAFHLEDHEGYL